MAYISKERVAEIRAELKAAFPGVKFSVTNKDYSGVDIKIIKSTVDFFDDSMRKKEPFGNYAKQERYTQINEFFIAESWQGEAAEMLLKINEIASKGCYNRNAGDLTADYPDWNFFVWIRIGSYDKPYEVIENEKAAA